ncbi:MAG: AI-2E family transporter [Patescibacteria group bacterium]
MSEENKKTTINISSVTLIKILVIVISLVFLFYIRNIILIVFVAVILTSAFDPWVGWLHRHRIPRVVGILLIYLVLFSVLAGAIYLIIPPIVIEVNELSKDFPFYWEKINNGFSTIQNFSDQQGWGKSVSDSLAALQSNIGLAANSVLGTIFSFFGGVVSFFIIIMLTFYMTVEEQALKRSLRFLVPVKYQPYVSQLINRMQEKIGLWFRGQLALSLIIFLACLIGLSALQVKYALVLALFAGVTEIIPYLGPFLGAIPAVFVAFTQSPILALWVFILYIVIQQLENTVLVPKVMQKAVGLNPVIVIIVVLIGARLAGVLGVLLSVPVATALSVAVEDLLETKKEI